MSDWKTRLAGIGDDYLAGIANKGIVKRAYKDKQETETEVLSMGEDAGVRVGEETVTIRIPLGDSKCTCPSRSICRHVILGILALREKCGEAAEPSGEASAESSEDARDAAAQREESGTGDSKAAALQEEGMSQALAREIAEYPVSALRKTMGTRNFQAFLRQLKAGIGAKITQGAVAAVQLPGDAYRVTLLSPLEYSACSCHKKEFCAHKAEAILWYKLQNGNISQEELSGELLESPEFSMEKIWESAGRMQDFLLELFNTGLPRTSPDILDNLERLSLMAHESGLANYEGYFRALWDSYQRYLNRVASFQTRDLLAQITRLYRRVEMLLNTESAAEIAKLAGEFRADYLEIGTLELRGVAVREFESQTGYAGETVYMLEENTQEWYTYTAARSVFYDTKGKRGKSSQTQAPWGLEMPLEGMPQISFRLTGAKCDERRRLSSSQESRAEIQPAGKSLSFEETKWYYQDFEKLFREQIRKKDTWLFEQDDSRQEEQRLVFLQPAFCEKAKFDGTQQKLSMPLYDGMGREVVVEMTYSRKEDWGIRYLERIHPETPPCFFGRIYLRDGKIRMYPIAAFHPSGREAQDEAKTEQPSATSDRNAQEEPKNRQNQERVQAVQILAEFLDEVVQVLEITLQSGFDAPTDGVLEDLKRMSELAGQYRMEFLAKSLKQLGEQLKLRRHSIRIEEDGGREMPARILCDLMEYIYLCREKTAYDMAAECVIYPSKTSPCLP